MESSEKIAWSSILVNLLLVGIKTAVALISGSLAVTADAIHSLSDVVSSIIILIGIKISGRPARGFPYGLYKVENLVENPEIFRLMGRIIIKRSACPTGYSGCDWACTNR